MKQRAASVKTNKMDKPLPTVIKKKKKRTQINKVRNEKGVITTYTMKTPRIMRNYYEQIYINKMWMNRMDS